MTQLFQNFFGAAYSFNHQAFRPETDLATFQNAARQVLVAATPLAQGTLPLGPRAQDLDQLNQLIDGMTQMGQRGEIERGIRVLEQEVRRHVADRLVAGDTEDKEDLRNAILVPAIPLPGGLTLDTKGLQQAEGIIKGANSLEEIQGWITLYGHANFDLRTELQGRGSEFLGALPPVVANRVRILAQRALRIVQFPVYGHLDPDLLDQQVLLGEPDLMALAVFEGRMRVTVPGLSLLDGLSIHEKLYGRLRDAGPEDKAAVIKALQDTPRLQHVGADELGRLISKEELIALLETDQPLPANALERYHLLLSSVVEVEAEVEAEPPEIPADAVVQQAVQAQLDQIDAVTRRNRQLSTRITPLLAEVASLQQELEGLFGSEEGMGPRVAAIRGFVDGVASLVGESEAFADLQRNLTALEGSEGGVNRLRTELAVVHAELEGYQRQLMASTITSATTSDVVQRVVATIVVTPQLQAVLDSIERSLLVVDEGVETRIAAFEGEQGLPACRTWIDAWSAQLTDVERLGEAVEQGAVRSQFLSVIEARRAQKVEEAEREAASRVSKPVVDLADAIEFGGLGWVRDAEREARRNRRVWNRVEAARRRLRDGEERVMRRDGALATLQERVRLLEGRADITPADLQKLREELAGLQGRADVTPEEVTWLRTQITDLEQRAEGAERERDARANISPEALADLQGKLREAQKTLEGRGEITVADLAKLRVSLAAFGEETPEGIRALRDKVTELEGQLKERGEITPDGLTALRKQVTDLQREVGELTTRAEDEKSRADKAEARADAAEAQAAARPDYGPFGEPRRVGGVVMMRLPGRDGTPQEEKPYAAVLVNRLATGGLDDALTRLGIDVDVAQQARAVVARARELLEGGST